MSLEFLTIWDVFQNQARPTLPVVSGTWVWVIMSGSSRCDRAAVHLHHVVDDDAVTQLGKSHTAWCRRNLDPNSCLPHFICTVGLPLSHPSALIHKLAECVSIQFGNALAHFHGSELQNEPPSSISTRRVSSGTCLQTLGLCQNILQAIMWEKPCAIINSPLDRKAKLHVHTVVCLQSSMKLYVCQIVSHVNALSYENS